MISEESIEGRDFVRCELCGECMKQLQNHVIKVHNITLKRYSELFPDTKISSDSSFEAKSIANKRRHVKMENHHYSKRFVYLLPNGKYASKSDVYRVAWGVDTINPEHVIAASEVRYVPLCDRIESEGVEGDDYVKCRICGEAKGNLSQHIRKFHNMTVKQYKNAYSDAEVHCKKVKIALSNASKKKWQTQFANGISTPTKHKPCREGDGLTKGLLEQYFNDGFTCTEIASRHGLCDATVGNRCRKFGIVVPPISVLRIRKAVKNGAERNLETDTFEEIEAVIRDYGKVGALKKYGVEKNLFKGWVERLKN